MKKVIGIFGSPRANGNSDKLLNCALEGAKANGAVIERIIVRDLRIAPCNSCGGCFGSGECVIHDDMQNVYSKLVNADGIIVASPTYFMGVSAQLKAVIDRCQAFWARKYILKVSARENGVLAKGFFLATAARSNGEGLFAGAINTIKSFFHVLDTQYIGDLLCAGLEEQDAINKKKEILQQAKDMGKQLLLNK